jgi:hypothetical protein
MGGLRGVERNLYLERLQIRRVEQWIALPKERRLRRVVPKRERGLIFPNAPSEDVILEIPADAGKMLHDIDAGTS